MWFWRDDERVEFPLGPIAAELAAKGVFVFLGHRRPVSRIKNAHDVVLDDMDRFLPLYEYIESRCQTKPFSNKVKEGFAFRSGKRAHLYKTKATYAERTLDVNLRHTFLLDVLERQLKERYGLTDVVFRENPSGLGQNSIDLVVHQPSGCWFYDIKTYLEPRLCVREALGQLLEYAFWPGCKEACRLIVVGESAPDSDVREYCRRLKKRFSLPIEYQQIVV